MISVVVPAYNEEQTISKCLKVIASQNCELIIVVGGNDKTNQIAKQYGTVLKDKKNIGAGAARNQGAKAAKGDIILFTDGDTIVPQNWIKEYKKVFLNKNVVAAGGIVKPLEGSLLDKLIYGLNQNWLYKLTALIGLYQLSGNNCGYRKKTFLGFDEEMSFLEDTELPMRMKKLGNVKTVGIPVWTSPRRMKKGYFTVWIQFMKAYFNWFILGKKPKKEYFASSKTKH